MRRSVLFVHGTGVREASYKETFGAVRARLADIRPGLDVRGCFWGREQGASMTLDGASVPHYRRSRGGAPEDDEIEIWEVLYEDPWYELRLLGLQPAPDAGFGFGLPPSDEFLAEVTGYVPGPAVVGAFAARGLDGELAEALKAVAGAPELHDAAATADADGTEHRRAFALAVVAMTLALSFDRGGEVSGMVRDELLAVLGTELYAEGRSVGGFLAKALARPVGWRGRHRRGRGATPPCPPSATSCATRPGGRAYAT
ncbi:hypothetical protein [Streptomyces sp. NBC_00158]|uniref:hypothetical protein n=1 Tax=Streptomyces sp. NBC_00158 TaxID=2903627 RepID=UPI003247156B